MENKRRENILVFGASTTFGSSDPEGRGWVGRLGAYVEKRTSYDEIVYNLGVSGDTTADLMKRLEAEAVARTRSRKPTIIISIGTNDAQYLNEPGNMRTPPEAFKNNLQALLDTAKKITGDVVFVGYLPVDEAKTTPIPWSPDKNYTNENVKRYNGMARDVCERNGIRFIELFDVLMGLDYKRLLDDGLHPNAEGHQKIFEIVKERLIEFKVID
jgi:lysophospholipase L1-like esterase